ncbi:aminotransferase class I/II-fold pyridoxal phosphate-dependent enzyme [Chitinophaga oryzae]|uniref:GDP-perosamine synthase n=1 Tax=Chitinophaga oryzae TaxID=2725414 RepID=A0AAE7D7G9_9BACT|nr:aminotransferase class I/II-fold pyridoxal phosphate-dependent enzyme [Chitinophaga oryzae]QJB32372.1 aminotransferase class I/II-fold pyridoxal phosphate-dependent enzyme [Chitinophaga oryzae]QJB38846.1 aminotransferase class I/II-fold pyridoxal phosphate-dependent enzyme [Chitinophaga oryzae]
MNEKIWLSSPHMGGQELEYVKEAFQSNWIAPLGPNVDGFENDLAKYTGSPFAAALSAGTAALHLALILLDVKSGDEVLCQSMTFSASANPIAYQGATPVFVDSEKDTWNIDPVLLEEAIKDRIAKGKKPKAIIPVHLYGMPAKMAEILAVAAKYEIPVVEDAAEALGSLYQGKACGTLGELGILSFNGNKIITTSGGGALIGSNGDQIKKARFLATQARDNAPHYEHTHIGFNYRMSNICAGIGRGQMQVLDDRVEKRRRNFDYYVKELAGVPGISFLQEPEGSVSNRWLSTILVNPKESGGVSRETIRLALEKENIESRPLWKPMHMQPVFSGAPAYVNGVSEKLFEDGLCLPSGSNLTIQQLESIVANIKKLWD